MINLEIDRVTMAISYANTNLLYAFNLYIIVIIIAGTEDTSARLNER